MKLLAFVLGVYWIIGFFSALAGGGGGIQVAQLTTAISNTELNIPVGNTSGWLNADTIWIDDERIAYTSKNATTLIVPNVAARGYDGTEAVAHLIGARVYTRTTSVFNRMASYNIGVVAETDGWSAFIKIPIAVVKLLFSLFTVDLGFLGAGEWVDWAENAWSIFGIAVFIWFALAWRSGRTV